MSLNIDKILRKIDVKKLKVQNTNVTYEQALISELKRFKNILQDEMEKSYFDYTPSIYKRRTGGGDFLNSFSVNDDFKFDMLNRQITVSIDINSNTWHHSIIDNSISNTILLMNYGWSWDSPHHGVWAERFSYYEGSHFIEKAIDRFYNEGNKYNIKIKLDFPDIWYK